VEIFIISFFVFVLMALALSLGLLFGRQPVKGSCGGLNRIPGLENSCSACKNKQCPRKAKDQ
jgi:hypothetical protein